MILRSQHVWAALFALAAAALLSNLLVPLVARAAMLVRAMDYPGGRRQQRVAIPRLGGIAIVASLGTVALAVALAQWSSLKSSVSRREMVALVIASAVVFLVGLLDDLTGVSSWKKFLIQVFAALFLVHIGWSFHNLSLPGLGSVPLGMLGPALSVVWIVGVSNAVNLLDGLDGLASGVVAIIALSFLAYALVLGNPGTVILMAATAGACLGFLRHNWAPARIFMGDSGSLTLGFLLGAMSVHSSIKAPAAIAILVPVLALGVPIIDTLLVMLVRFLSRPHNRPTDRMLAMFRADRNHLHHLLLHWKPTRSRVVLSIYALVVVSCAVAVTVAVTNLHALGLLVLGVEVAVVGAIRQLGMRGRVREMAAARRRELRAELSEGEPTVVPLAAAAASPRRPV